MEIYIERALSLALVIYGLSHIVQRRLWAEFLSQATGHRFGAFFIAIPTLAIGLLIVAGHNVWVMGIPVITTLLGWAYVLKGTAYLLWPHAVRKAMPPSDKADRALFVIGLGMAVLGAVMAWHAWLA